MSRFYADALPAGGGDVVWPQSIIVATCGEVQAFFAPRSDRILSSDYWNSSRQCDLSWSWVLNLWNLLVQLFANTHIIVKISSLIVFEMQFHRLLPSPDWNSLSQSKSSPQGLDVRNTVWDHDGMGYSTPSSPPDPPTFRLPRADSRQSCPRVLHVAACVRRRRANVIRPTVNSAHAERKRRRFAIASWRQSSIYPWGLKMHKWRSLIVQIWDLGHRPVAACISLDLHINCS